MFVFGPHLHCGSGTPVTSLAVLGVHFSLNCLCLGLRVLGEAPCGCSSSSETYRSLIPASDLRITRSLSHCPR